MTADNSDILRRSLFQIGDWHIVKSGYPMPGNTVYAVHTNCGPTAWNAIVRVRDQMCFRCGDPVPDELQALVTLHHWDNV